MKKARNPEPAPEPEPPVPPVQDFSAEWDSGDGRSGVYTNAGGFVWWYQPSGPGGRFGEVGSDQSYDDFFANGPQGHPVPSDVLGKVEEVAKARSKPRKRHNGEKA